MKGSLRKAFNSIKYLKEEAFTLKDELVAIFYQYFERAKEKITLFYRGLALSRMDLFKVVRDSQLVDNE